MMEILVLYYRRHSYKSHRLTCSAWITRYPEQTRGSLPAAQSTLTFISKLTRRDGIRDNLLCTGRQVCPATSCLLYSNVLRYAVATALSLVSPTINEADVYAHTRTPRMRGYVSRRAQIEGKMSGMPLRSPRESRVICEKVSDSRAGIAYPFHP